MKTKSQLPTDGFFGFGAFQPENTTKECDYCSNTATKFVYSMDRDGAFADIESYACDDHDNHFKKVSKPHLDRLNALLAQDIE
jgi:6-phosphogluconolactonase (cycloisomerase 2 family)